MTLRRQIRRALGWGLGAAALGLGLAPVAMALDRAGWTGAGAVAAALSVAALAGGLMLALAGGAMRAFQARVFRAGQPSGRLRDFILRRGALRWWYWVDERGRDRDG